MRVKAVPERMIPILGADGTLVVNAFAGLDRRTRAIMPRGEVVEDIGGYYAKAVEQEDLQQLPLELEEVSQ